MDTFKTWLETNNQILYQQLGKEIFSYLLQLRKNVGNEITPEEAEKKIIHAFSDDILDLHDPELEKMAVTQIRLICKKAFKQTAAYA
jgi:hypothetical protein